MSTFVVVIASDARRATVKVTPASFLNDVLQEACKKLKLSSDRYLLKHSQKLVDLAIPFRLSGLSNGAKLDLVVKSNSPSVVEVGLQLPDLRLNGKFSSATTLWKVLRQFESGEPSAGHNVNITARGVAQTHGGAHSGSGQLYYQSPCMHIMSREYSNMEDFQKTLSQCGINTGRILIRVSFRDTTTPFHEAIENMRQFMDEVDPKEERKEPGQGASDSAEPKSEDGTAESRPLDTGPEVPGLQSQPRAVLQQSPASNTDTSTTNDSSSQTQPRDFLAPVNVFSAPIGPVPAAALRQEDDVVYEPTIAHAKLHQARLQASSHNRRLKSDEELAAEREAETARLAAVTSLNIKVRFPDQDSAKWVFPATATGATIYAAVRGVMAHPEWRFKLVLPGGAGAIADAEGREKDSLVKGYRLRGSVLLNLTWDDSVPEVARRDKFLKAAVAQQAEPVPIPKELIVEDVAEEKETSKPASGPAKTSAGGKNGGSAMPKWWKGVGKK